MIHASIRYYIFRWALSRGHTGTTASPRWREAYTRMDAEIDEGAGGLSTTSAKRSGHTSCVARGRTSRATLLAPAPAGADAADAHRACPRGGAAPPRPDNPLTPCRGTDGPHGGRPPRPAAVRRRLGQQYP